MAVRVEEDRQVPAIGQLTLAQDVKSTLVREAIEHFNAEYGTSIFAAVDNFMTTVSTHPEFRKFECVKHDLILSLAGHHNFMIRRQVAKHICQAYNSCNGFQIGSPPSVVPVEKIIEHIRDSGVGVNINEAGKDDDVHFVKNKRYVLLWVLAGIVSDESKNRTSYLSISARTAVETEIQKELPEWNRTKFERVQRVKLNHPEMCIGVIKKVGLLEIFAIEMLRKPPSQKEPNYWAVRCVKELYPNAPKLLVF